MKFSEIVEKYESESNGRVIFIVIDNESNVMGEYELEEYNKGDEESVNTYNAYSNRNCKVTEITYHMMWTKVTCEVLESEVK